MEKRLVFLVYQTDAWHTVKTRELVYIGENMEDAKQLRQWRQTSCNNRDFEVVIERQFVNDFTV